MLPLFQDANRTLMLLQNSWRAQLNPLLNAPMSSGFLLTGVALKNGATVVNHGLQRLPQGWFLTDINNSATIYRSAAFNELTLTLTSSAAVTVNLFVF